MAMTNEWANSDVLKTAAIWDEEEFARLEQNASLILETVKGSGSAGKPSQPILLCNH
jgi:3-dehydroquinate synthetase